MEFQAVVLCGPGRRLHPITAGKCKSLLPIGNRPMVQYAVEWCARAGFARTIVAVPEADYEQIEAACHAFELKVALFQVPDGTEAGRVLQLLAAAGALDAQCDLAVLPCDFVTDLDPDVFVSAVRSQDDNTVVTGFYYRNTLESLDAAALEPDVLLHSSPDAPGASGSYDGTGGASANGSSGSSGSGGAQYLLDGYARRQVKDAKLLKARMAMLWQFPRVTASMDLLRAAIYFVRRRALAFDDIEFNQPLAKLVRDLARRTWRHRVPHETVAMQLLPPKSLFLRANTLPAYVEANRQRLREQAKQAHAPRPREPGQAVIGNDSMVGQGTAVGERSSVKRTAIGANCEVGKKCRLNGCVILDNVTIGNDVTLENCLVGARAVIELKSRLVNCSVEGGYTVPSETEAKNEVLKGLSMEGIDDDEFGDMYESISEDSAASGSDEESEEDAPDDDDEDDLFDRS